MLPVFAVSIADCALPTELTIAVNDTLVAVAGTVTKLGTVTAALLLASATVTPPAGAEPDRLTVQESASDPVTEVLLHDTALTVGVTEVPAPLKVTVAVGAVLEIVSCPVIELAVVGSNRTVNTVEYPGFRVIGKLPPETENPAPEIESELTVTDAVPLEVTVTDFVTAVPSETLPNASDVELRLRALIAAFSCSATLFDEEFALAVIVAVADVLTADTLAVNDAVDAPEATATLAGTVTALLLLARATLTPLEEAGELSDTVQVVVSEPVNELLPQDNPLSVETGADVASAAASEIETDSTTLSWVAVIIAVWFLLTETTLAVNDAVDAPEATVTPAGTVTALLLLANETLTPPEAAGELSDTVQVVVAEPVNESLPQDKPLSVEVSVDVAGAFSEIETDSTTLPWVAVIVAVWSVLTADTLAVNVTLVAPDGTVTEAGAFTAAVLLDRFTTRPFVGAALFAVTVQVSAPAPVIVVLEQLTPLRAAVVAGVAGPEDNPLATTPPHPEIPRDETEIARSARRERLHNHMVPERLSR